MKTERDLRDLEERHLRADVRASAQALESLLAEEFVEVGSSGRVFDRAAVIASLSKEAAFQSRIDAFVARELAPGVALTTYRLSSWSESEDQVRVTLRSSVWVRRSGRWMLAFHQGTVASGGAGEKR